MKTKNFILLLLSLLTILFACKKEDPVIIQEPQTFTVSGCAQKGPFRPNATITISELDSSLKSTGSIFFSSVSDNRGNYEAPDLKLGSGFVQVTADGFYYNENNGNNSSERLVLKAISNVKDSTKINVNVLTDLSVERIKYLIKEEGKSYQDAKKQAQNEILKIFNLESSISTNFEYLDISETGELNSKLLAISSIIQGDKDIATISEFLSLMSSDIKTDGALNQKELQQDLITSALARDINSIKDHLIVIYPTFQPNDAQLYLNQFIDNTSFIPLETSHTYDVTGFVQKGPFRSGSTITISELDSQLNPTGLNYYSTVTDNLGSFEVPDVELKSSYIQLMSDGYYFNENFGIITDGRLVLKAVADLSDSSMVNVNILTHITNDRIIYLIQNEGKTFAQAKLQAQNELLKVFSLEDDDQTLYEHVDLIEDGELNSKLFAISMIIQGFKGVAQLSEYITSIVQDFKTDGTIDNKDIQQNLVTSAIFCNVGDIRKNILSLYNISELNDFQKYVSEFIEKTSFEPSYSLNFETQTGYGENLLALPDNSTLSTNKTYCIDQHLEIPFASLYDFYITIVEEEKTGNISYTKIDSTTWQIGMDYISYEGKEIYYGVCLWPLRFEKYSDTPLLLNFKGSGEIRVKIYVQIPDKLPDNGGLYFVTKFYKW